MKIFKSFEIINRDHYYPPHCHKCIQILLRNFLDYQKVVYSYIFHQDEVCKHL